MMDLTNLFSEATMKVKSSKIRELMKMASVPGIISLGGGMPDSTSFPFEEIKDIINNWTPAKASIALQYGTTNGYGPLIDKLKERMERVKHISMEGHDIIVTTGSQQALALLSKLFLDPGDVVLVEIPSFIGAIASIYSFTGDVVGVPMDDEGMLVDDLTAVIERCVTDGRKVKFIYTIPNFNNPSGITTSQGRRRKLLDVSNRYKIPVVEDDPYGDLFYDGTEDDYRPIKSLDGEGNVLYLGTFSKVLSPGMRLGWILGPSDVVAKAELLKQSFDACTPTFSQLIALDYLEKGYMDAYIGRMRDVYRKKRDAALGALDRHMPPEVTWTRPSGGLFVWLTLPDYLDSVDVFKKSVERKVAFVTGDAFLPEDHRNNVLRLAFSNLSEDKIEKGIEILADVLRGMLR